MKTISTAPDAGLFRTNRTAELPTRVDRAARVIFGANMMQLGDINDDRAQGSIHPSQHEQ
jgi:hypothetical protein